MEPRGAELAHPSDDFGVAEGVAEPDPEGRIHRDEEGYVRVESTMVPVRIGPARSARVHLEFRPTAENDAHWNNEVGGLTVWLDPPEGWAVDQRMITVMPPTDSAVSDEVRRVEFEIRSPESPHGPGEIKAYALYYVCEGRQGQCLYRRQDLSLQIDTMPDPR